jgi:hypothetical protein
MSGIETGCGKPDPDVGKWIQMSESISGSRNPDADVGNQFWTLEINSRRQKSIPDIQNQCTSESNAGRRKLDSDVGNQIQTSKNSVEISVV